MTDIAMIIGAITALITAFSGVILAASKLEPVLKAINKMLADHHKRTKEAKNKAADQSTVSTKTSSGLRPSFRSWRSRIPALVICSGSFTMIVLQLFAKGPATIDVVVTCTLASITIILVITAELTETLLRAILFLYGGFRETVDLLTESATINKTFIEKIEALQKQVIELRPGTNTGSSTHC
jgi:hypothetical protein